MPFETWMLVVVFVFAFSAVMGGAEIISTRRNLNALNRRMRPLYTAEARRKKSVLDRYEAKLAHSDYGSELGEKLKGANLTLSPLRWMAIQAGIFSALSMLLGVLLSLKFPFNLIVSFYLTVFLSRKWLKSRRNKFAQLVNSQLPEVSRMLASCLRAGMSIQQSIETVARELKAPAGPLFNAMSQQLHLGTSVEAVFEKMSERFSSKDFQLLLKTIIIQRKAGGNLGQALDHLAKTLEDRARMNQELSNQTAESRYIAITLAVIPIVLIIGFNVVFDGFIMPLFTIPGLILLVVVAILMTIGFLAIRKVSNIKA